MPFKQRTEDRYTEEEIEKKFGLSSSKFRSAQRIKLVRSDAALSPERRVIRIWTIPEIIKVWYANQISYYLTVPFVASAEMLIEVQAHREIDLGVATLTQEHVNKYPNPEIHIYDRKFVTGSERGVDEYLLGILTTDESGRTQFTPGGEWKVPNLGEWTSCTVLSIRLLRNKLHKIIADLT